MSTFADAGQRASSSGRGDLAHKVAAAGRLVWAVLLWPARVHANRRILHTLGGMSDYELSDIGLTRQDIEDTAALPLSSEVGRFLSSRVGERRQRR